MFHQHTRSRILLSRRIKRNNIRRLTDNDICFCDLPAFCTLRSCLSLSAGRSTCRRSCSIIAAPISAAIDLAAVRFFIRISSLLFSDRYLICTVLLKIYEIRISPFVTYCQLNSLFHDCFGDFVYFTSYFSTLCTRARNICLY